MSTVHPLKFRNAQVIACHTIWHVITYSCWDQSSTLLIKLSEILIKIQKTLFAKMHSKMLSAKWWPFCRGRGKRWADILLQHFLLTLVKLLPNTNDATPEGKGKLVRRTDWKWFYIHYETKDSEPQKCNEYLLLKHWWKSFICHSQYCRLSAETYRNQHKFCWQSNRRSLSYPAIVKKGISNGYGQLCRHLCSVNNLDLIDPLISTCQLLIIDCLHPLTLSAAKTYKTFW